MNFFESIHKVLLHHPDKKLITWPFNGANEYFTGGDLLQKVAAIRGSLAEKKLKPDD